MPTLTDDERLDWLRLIRSDNVGPRTFGWLLRQYGDARSAIAALPQLSRRGGASRAIRVYPRADAEHEMAAARKLGVALVGLARSLTRSALPRSMMPRRFLPCAAMPLR